MRKIISLNIRHGGGKPHTLHLIEWVIRQNPDLIVLHEWRNKALGTLLIRNLKDKGYQYGTIGDSSPKRNGMLIAAKESIEVNRITPAEAERGELGLFYWQGIKFCVAYFPQNNHKKPFFQKCFDIAVQHRDMPLIILGDLNTGRNDRDVETGGTAFHCAGLFVDLEAKYRLVDLWRAHHGETARSYTWRSAKFGFRIDHAFANAKFLETYATRCDYDDHPRLSQAIGGKAKNPTDHSALILTFDLLEKYVQLENPG